MCPLNQQEELKKLQDKIGKLLLTLNGDELDQAFYQALNQALKDVKKAMRCRTNKPSKPLTLSEFYYSYKPQNTMQLTKLSSSKQDWTW